MRIIISLMVHLFCVAHGVNNFVGLNAMKSMPNLSGGTSSFYPIASKLMQGFNAFGNTSTLLSADGSKTDKTTGFKKIVFDRSNRKPRSYTNIAPIERIKSDLKGFTADPDTDMAFKIVFKEGIDENGKPIDVEAKSLEAAEQILAARKAKRQQLGSLQSEGKGGKKEAILVQSARPQFKEYFRPVKPQQNYLPYNAVGVLRLEYKMKNDDNIPVKSAQYIGSGSFIDEDIVITAGHTIILQEVPV